LRHPGLVPGEVFWSPAGRLVLLTDPNRQTLRSCFDRHQKNGQAGIPRTQLLSWLRIAAEALDELACDQGLFHLGLNPVNMVVEGDRLLLADFGLVPLVWMPTGQPVTVLNQRYSAPELAANTLSSSSDQYSLALIYAEMLTGIYPRINRPGSRSGSHHRPGAPGRTSNTHRMARVVDLDFLPTGDREILAQALHDDPTQRFPSCLALIQALEAVTVVATPEDADPFVNLPLVLPFKCLLDRSMPNDLNMPLPGQIVAQWISAIVGHLKEETYENVRFWNHPDGTWEYQCPIQFHAGLTRCKLEGFRQHWNAQTISEDATSFVFKVFTEAPAKRFWSVRKNTGNTGMGLEILIQISAASMPVHLSETTIRIRSFGKDNGEVDKVRRQQMVLVPRLFQSLRGFLQASPEQRAQQRFPFPGTLRVCPILPNLEVAGVIEAHGRNISQGGMSFLVPSEMQLEFVYLQLHQAPEASALALLARVVRMQPTADGRYDVGVTFQVDAPPINEKTQGPAH
jgi:serine/threonine protein kinase